MSPVLSTYFLQNMQQLFIVVYLLTITTISSKSNYLFHGAQHAYNHETAEESNLVMLAHKENMVLITFENPADALKTVPEMIRIDECRFLLKNDVYLENNLNLLRKTSATMQKEKGWATISVVFDKTATKSKNVTQAEIIPSSENVICYLLKEEYLSSSLLLLYGHYILGK